MIKFFIFNMMLSLIMVFLILLVISFFTLWESKLLAGIQSSHGPVFTGSHGLLQPFADGLKLLTKPVNMPLGGYYYIYIMSSMVSLVLSLLSWSVIPFNSSFVFADMNLGVIFLLAISSLNVYTIMFSGWSSNSKYGLLGSISSGAQMMSYELPLSISMLPIMLVSSSANLLDMMFYQLNNVWFICLFPFAFIFFIASLAETNSTPFDLPEAESELVAGYNMEYSSLSFAVFFLAEYNHMLLMSVLFNMLYLGGWSLFPLANVYTIVNDFYDQVPSLIKIYMWFIKNVYWTIAYFCSGIITGTSRFISFMDYLQTMNFFQTMFLIVKSFLMASFFVVMSASVPSYKFTQLMSMCWIIFIPVALFFLFMLLLVVQF